MVDLKQLEEENRLLKEEINLINQARAELANISLLMHFITDFALNVNKTTMNDFVASSKDRLQFLFNSIGISFFMLYVHRRRNGHLELTITNLNIPSYQIFSIPDISFLPCQPSTNSIATKIDIDSFPLAKSLKKYIDNPDNYHYFAVNLKVGDDPVGLLLLGKTKESIINNLTFEDVVGQIKVILEGAIKNIQLYEELTEKARFDQLTQLYNRASFLEYLEKEIKRVSRYHHPFCLAIVDLDDLKKLNDTYGHLYGDTVLKEFAGLLKNSFRQTDVIGRYGGDEFVILFVETDLNGATIAIERLYQLMNAKNFPSTMSVGLTEFKKDDTVNSIIDRADKALYTAKVSGKKHLEVL